MNIKKIYCLVILFISGCASRIRQARKEKINREITLRVQPCLRTKPACTSLSDYQITRDQAIGIALRENPILNAAWSHLGVAHADLEEAGLYTNPTLAGVFGPVINHRFLNPSPEIYITLVGKLSDVWIVPIKEKIAEDELAIASWQTTTQILETIKSTHIAYDTCVFAQQQLNAAERLLTLLQHHKPATDAQSFDDTSYDIAHQKIKLEMIKKQSAYQESRIHLASALGLDPSLPFELTDRLPTSNPTPFDTAELINYAYLHQPYLIIARLKKHQALYKLKERGRRIFDNVQIGLDYQQDSAKDRGFGPIIQTDIPIFNTQHASIERARAYIAECEHVIIASERKIQENVALLVLQIQAIDAEIELRSLHQPSSSKDQRTISSKDYLAPAINEYESLVTMSNLLMSRSRLSAELDYTVGARWQYVISPLHLIKDTV